MWERSHDGPEVDYVLESNGQLTPIEVKWTQKPDQKDIRHLLRFREEYGITEMGYLVCRCDRPMLLAEHIMAIPWQKLGDVVQIE